MITKRIFAPNQSVILDISEIQSGNYAESEILFLIESENTTLYLPQSQKVSGFPAIYISPFADQVGATLIVKTQNGDVLWESPPATEFSFNKAGIKVFLWAKFKKLIVDDTAKFGVVGFWILEAAR